MPDSGIRSNAARFHLKDGRPLVFLSLRPSPLRRRAAQVVLTLLIATLGFIAASLFAKGHPDARPAGPGTTASLSARPSR